MCDLCEGKVIKAEEVGSGIQTVPQMLKWAWGFGSGEEESKTDGVWIEDGNILCYETSSGEYAYQGIEIKYCPLCGRELKHENNQQKETR